MSTNARNLFSPDEERKRLERVWENYRKETTSFIAGVEKNLQMAETLKTEGNLYYSKRKFRDSLMFYNAALCHAPLDSPLVGILYANRSAVYLESGLPIQCQENIQLALDHGYPANKREKLEERKAKCLEMFEQLPAEAITHEEKPFWVPVLSHPAHPKFPFLSNAVDIEIDEAEGPKLVAKKDLRPGDIYLIDPYDIRLMDYTMAEDCSARCAFCTLPCYLSLIPCSGCVHVMYCKNCLPKWEKIHKFECKTWESDTGIVLMVRVLVQTLDLYDFDLELLKKDIEEVQKTPKVLLEGDYVNDLNRQIIKWIFLRWWNVNSDVLAQREALASYLLEKLLHVNEPFKALVSTRERKITALQVLFSFPRNLSKQNQDMFMARFFYRPFNNNFYTFNANINSTFSSSHCQFNVCILPVNRGKVIKMGSMNVIMEDLPNEAPAFRAFSECMRGNMQPLVDMLKSRMPASYQVTKNIKIPGFEPLFEVMKFLERDMNVNMKNKDRYAEILDKISGHFPCFEVIFVMWLFLVLIRVLSEDFEYYLTTGLQPTAKNTKITEETKKIVARGAVRLAVSFVSRDDFYTIHSAMNGIKSSLETKETTKRTALVF